MKNSPVFLGIDTSNYTTSLSLVKNGRVISDVRQILPVVAGKCGLRQSDAVFLHTKFLPELSKKLFESSEYCPEDLCAVGVSEKPRDAENSYMPCFLAGLSFATGIAHSHKIPLFTFSHQACHIASAISSCENKNAFGKKFISFHISGGTSEAHISEFDGYSFNVNICGGTKDASAGQIIDRAGVLMGYPFPSGRYLDEICLKQTNDKKIKECTSLNGAYFNLSGLENKTKKYLDDGYSNVQVSRFIFDSIAKSIIKSVEYIRKDYGNLPVIFAGGVLSSLYMRNIINQSLENVYFSKPEYSCDNSVGIALLCENAFKTENGGALNGFKTHI